MGRGRGKSCQIWQYWGYKKLSRRHSSSYEVYEQFGKCPDFDTRPCGGITEKFLTYWRVKGRGGVLDVFLGNVKAN